MNFTKITLITLFVATTAAKAQKLPNKQTTSIWAPANVKIDGNAAEWGNFQAYNKATQLNYTLANDDNSLYLAVKTDDHFVADKILRGGITLIINHTLEKKDAQAVSITYPFLHDADMTSVANMFARESFDQGDGIKTTFDDLNKFIDIKAKTIGLEGIGEFPEKFISVYNEEGVKAVLRFDKKNAYTCEFAIPLKYLHLLADQPFSYHIKVNEEPPIHLVATDRPPPPTFINQLGTTDFWGEYTLAKKP